MKTRAALKALAGLESNSPLAEIRDTIVMKARAETEARNKRNAERIQLQGGAGPLLSALQKRLASYQAARLANNPAPAVTCGDLHTVLKTAAAVEHGKDKGLSRAATHVYRLWSKNPTGSLSVGDVARLRAHYSTEYPRSKVAEVIDTEVPKVGFNTLPLAQLTRIAAQIQRAGSTQEAYEDACAQHGLTQPEGHHFRCRAYIRAMVDGVAAEAEPSPAGDLATRVQSRLATDEDPILGRFAQLMDDEPEPMDAPSEMSMMEDELEPEPMGLMEEEPEPELEPESVMVNSPNTGEPLSLTLEDAPDEFPMSDELAMPEGMEVVGQLEDFASAVVEESAIVEDPTSPDGAPLEVTLRSVPEEPAEEPMDLVGPVEDEMMEPGDEMMGREGRRFEVFASVDGQMSREPIDRFAARSMSAALEHIANHGVRGPIMHGAGSAGQEAYIALDNGNYLHVVAMDEMKGKDEAFTPDIEEQQPAQMPEVDCDIMVGDECMGKSASLRTLADALVEGRVVKRAGWELQVNGDAEVELHYQGTRKRKASLARLDQTIATFVAVSAPEPLRYSAHRRTASGAYVVVTDIPEAENKNARRYNAMRMLKAVQRVIPSATGVLRKDAKLQLEFAAEQAQLGRVRHILEDQYRAQEYRVEAQAMDVADIPGAAATEGPMQMTPPSAVMSPQSADTPAGTVIAPQPETPQSESPTYVGPQKSAYKVTFRTPEGETAETPVQAKTAAAARDLFSRFNDDCAIIRVAQFADVEPGAPIGGEELPLEDQLMPMEEAPSVNTAQQDAMRAALVHYRNLGDGPARGVDQLLSQYSELFEQAGDVKDPSRHELEAEALAMAAEIWTQPAVLEKAAAGEFEPMIQTQQPDAAPRQSLGEDSETNDDVSESLEAPVINEQVAPSDMPKVAPDLGPDSETMDPGSYGAAAPVERPDQQPNAGEEFSPTSLGADSETDSKLNKHFDVKVAKNEDKHLEALITTMMEESDDNKSCEAPTEPAHKQSSDC